MTETKFTCVFYSWFSVKCQNPRGALSIPGRVGEHTQILGGPHRVLGGWRSPRREWGRDTQTQRGGRLQPSRRQERRKARVWTGAAVHGRRGVWTSFWGWSSPRWVGQLSQSPVLLYKQCVRARPPGVRAASSAGSCGAFSVRRESSGPRASHLWSGAETAAPVSWVSRWGTCPPRAQLGAGPWSLPWEHTASPLSCGLWNQDVNLFFPLGFMSPMKPIPILWRNMF